MKRSKTYISFSIIIILFAVIFTYYLLHTTVKNIETIKVGILFSKTGTMAASEIPVIKATLLAIEEINSKGGINGKIIKPVVYDGESNWKLYAQYAERLIIVDKVKVIFGCWTSASRKEVKPIIEKYNNLLIYPTQYEGVEESPNIIYLGETPNQQIIPAVAWVLEHYGKKAYIVGSDYIFPRVAHEIITNQVTALGGIVLGSQYLPLGSTDVGPVVDDIIQLQPDVIYNTINGDTNIAFFNKLSALTQGKKRPVVVSFSFSPNSKIDPKKIAGDYAAWSYFQSQVNTENTAFLKAYTRKYGSVTDINGPAVASYSGVHLWKQAVKSSPSPDPQLIHDLMLRQSVASPAGVIYIDPNNAHAWRTVMIGKINDKGQFDIVWNSFNPIQPIVYPSFMSKAEWDLLEYKLYINWNSNWENTEAQKNKL